MSIASVTGTALNFATMVFVIVFVGGVLITIVYLYSKYKRYKEYNVVIFERDGFGQLTQKKDTAGIFVDKKTHNKRLYLRKANVGLSPDNIPYLPSGKGGKTVYVMQTGLKNFQYINYDIDDKHIKTSVGEEDVNWAINAYERQKKLFSSSMLMQLMPYIAIAFVSIIILVIFIYFFKEFATLKEMAQLLKDMSENVAAAKSGTTIISGG